MTALAFDDLYDLSGGRAGKHDVSCPECGPDRKAKANRFRKVLRIWIEPDGYATYSCARCGVKGYAFEGKAAMKPIRPALRLVDRSEEDDAERQRRKANWLWRKSQPIGGTIAETYLRHRGIGCDLPATLRFLPPHKPEHKPAMIAPFGLPSEPEPGRLEIAQDHVRGVHLTLLAPDGLGKAGTERDKFMVGPSAGWPIVLAPPNDGLGMSIAEGIETAISVHQETGLGAWAAGSGGRLPCIAGKIPDYVSSVAIAAEDDPAGRRGAEELAGLLLARGVEVLEVANNGA